MSSRRRRAVLLLSNGASALVAVASTLSALSAPMRTVTWVGLVAGWLGVAFSVVAWRRELKKPAGSGSGSGSGERM